MNDQTKTLSASFALLPWPNTRGGPQVMMKRFVDSSRTHRYRVLPCNFIDKIQPCLLNIGHPRQGELLAAPRRVVYRVAGMFLEDHFSRLGQAYGDRKFKAEFGAANRRIRDALVRADFVIYQSHFSKEHLDTLHKRRDGSWMIIPNAVPLRTFSPAPNWPDSSNQCPVLGTVGAMRYRPRLEVFFDVARRLATRPRLLLVGSLDEHCKRTLMKAQADPYWHGAIHYVPSVNPRRLIQYYRKMDCLVHTVAADSCPNVVVEAMACGVPVVCPREGGSVELVGPGGIAVQDPQGLYGEELRDGMAEAVREVLEDLPSYRLKARERIERNNDIEKLTPKYLHALGFPPYGPERGWKYGAARFAGKTLKPLNLYKSSKNPRPRIALILFDWNLGGIASWMFRVAAELQEYEFHFIATHLAEHAPQCQDVGCFAFTPGFVTLFKYLRKHRFDIVQVSNNRWPVDAAKAAGVPHIIERTDGSRSCCSLSKKDLKHVIVSAAGTLPYIRQFWPDVPAEVIYNAVDLDEVDDTHPVHAAQEGTRVIGRCSRFGPGKRLDLLIEATRLLLTRGLPVQLTLAGEDSRLSGAASVEAALRRQAASLGDAVRFVGRSTTPLALAQGFDIGACSSDPFNEGIPNSLIEPMACSKPVVATAIDQVAELVEHGKNGFLVPPGDALGLANAFERLLTNDQLRADMGLAARQTIERRFSFSQAVGKYRALYRSLLEYDK